MDHEKRDFGTGCREAAKTAASWIMMGRKAGEPAEESFFLALLLTVTGGFLDAYTFCCRDQVFSNAQTGNVVRVGIALAMGNYQEVIRYLIPIFAFAGGVFLAMAIRDRYDEENRAAWRKRILVMEMLVAGVVSLVPMKSVPNIFANVLVSFLCALQAESFRKVGGKTFASTMCTGNLRSGTENLYQAITKKDRKFWKNAGQYFGIILTFIAGAAVGVFVSDALGESAILAVEIPLIAALGFLILS